MSRAELMDAEAAETMGFAPERLRFAWEAVREAVEAGETPGAVAIVSRRGMRLRYAYGCSVDDGSQQVPISFDTIYDCASLTKIAVTLPLLLLLIDRGRLLLSDPLFRYIPGFDDPVKRQINVLQLLTHTSGLAPFFDMSGLDRNGIIDFISQSELRSAPGTKIEYSDCGFILLGALIEKLTDMTLDEAAERELFRPLGMADAGFLPHPGKYARIAPTEYDADMGTCLRGIVHDPNARAMGGISGHAGLFAAADDLIRYAELWLRDAPGGQRLLSQAAMRAAISCRTASVPGGRRGLGWALKGDPLDPSGDWLSADTFGHTGFTGTSLVIDPISGLAAVLLTNRVHYGRDVSVVRLRARFHNALAAALA